MIRAQRERLPSTAVVSGILFVAFLSLQATACGSDERVEECSPTPPTPTTPTADGGSPDGDLCAQPSADPKCLDDSTSLFVSGERGSDTAEGSKGAPLRSVGEAISKVTPTRRRIFVCEGTYDEDIRITKVSGISILGGLTCAWTPTANRPRVGHGSNPLGILDASAITVGSISFRATDATVGSSIAALVVRSEVAFTNAELIAGKGGSGAPGSLTPYAFPTNLDLVGNSGDSGGAEKEFTCPGGAKTKGGAGGANGFNGNKGLPGSNDNHGIFPCGAVSTKGSNGVSAPSSQGASSLGTLDASGWLPASGPNGKDGGPGQGGGGGGGAGGGSGGSGGAGGCGGAGAMGGGGGGGSIALASHQSNVTMTSTTLESNDGGNGGDGADGQEGQRFGGPGGNSQTATPSCGGGEGGSGGDGGASGGGAGGISVGVLYSGTEPLRDDATKRGTRPGKKGIGGGPAARGGREGVSVSSLMVDE